MRIVHRYRDPVACNRRSSETYRKRGLKLLSAPALDQKAIRTRGAHKRCLPKQFFNRQLLTVGRGAAIPIQQRLFTARVQSHKGVIYEQTPFQL